MSCSGVVSVSFIGSDSRNAGLSTNVPIPCNVGTTIDYSNGTAANQFNVLYDQPRTFSGTTDTINLTDVMDSWNTTDDNARVKAWGVINTGSAAITVGGGSNAWTSCLNGTAELPPGAFCAFATPDATAWAVTASTAMNLQVAGTIGQGYSVVLFGANA